MNKTTIRNTARRLCALLLTICLSLSALPVLSAPAEAAVGDTAMDKLLNWGVVGGYPDGGLHPERNLTRAEFAAMVNRAYGYTETGPTPFTDVPETSWYHDDISIAYNAKYLNGTGNNQASPNKELTREQALVLLARNMRMEPTAGEVTEFSDGRGFSSWSRGYARTAAQTGLIGGYPDGSYKPQQSITRGEMAILMQRALGSLVNNPGTHTLSDVYGNVTVSSPDATLKDTTIAGNLYVTGGLGLGDVTLENVRVLGDIIVAGGGESSSGESVILRNVEANSLLIDSMADQYVSLRSEGNTSIADTTVRSDAFIQDRSRPGQGLLNISLDSPDQNAVFTLSGNLENVVNKTPGSTLNIASGTADVLTVDEVARGSNLHLDINSTVMTLNLDTGAAVQGIGDIDKLNVNTAGSNVEMLPDDIEIRPGISATIAGTEMNAAQARESSSDPRLLAGYPKVRNVAPTTATAVYAANKAGTVYWAVSETADGSVHEDELITPTAGSTTTKLTGNLPVTESTKEFTSNLTRLTADTSYYLSAVLIDARDRHSPVKVTSFLTPDNTVPNFSTGYPAVVQNNYSTLYKKDASGNPTKEIDRDEDGNPLRNYHVQVSSMPTKTCKLYYALYPKGSTAPTAQQFRAGTLGTPVQSGVEDAAKNYINFIDFYELTELTTYDLYLCLIDSDGSRSSAVRKITFTTVDGKPPRFQYDTPIVTAEAATSLTLNVNVSENSTVFWAVSRSDIYIKDPNTVSDSSSDWDPVLWWESATRQIESGTNSIRSGRVSARQDTDSRINITGLTAATGYYIYFVAKDSAGNYSEFVKANVPPNLYRLQANTLDDVPPTARQEFDHYSGTDLTMPYADTNVRIQFSESVMQYSTNRALTKERFTSLYDLYLPVAAAQTAYDEATDAAAQAKARADLMAAQDTLAATLNAIIKLYNTASTTNSPVEARNSSNEGEIGNDWVIDYRKAVVEYDPDTGRMSVVFNNDAGAIKLSSGATYYFMLDDIADTASSMNRMGRTQLDNFTTVSAQVTLRSVNANSITGSDGSTIPIDMAFSMTPVSTNVEDDVDWDMLFWSDSSVKFNIYELTPRKDGGNGYDGSPVFPGSISEVEIVNDNSTETVNDRDYAGYIGRSLFRDFYRINFNPSLTGKGTKLSDNNTLKTAGVSDESGSMVSNETKYYGIHFTEVRHTSEGDNGANRGVWDAIINFRISVLTGSSVNLGNLAQNITNTTLQSYKSQWGVSEIHSPVPFKMQKQFANSEAPLFYPGYPQFIPSDVNATLRVMLDRPGTLYYAVAPVSVTTRASDDKLIYNPSIGTTLIDEDVPSRTTSISDQLTDLVGKTPYASYSSAWDYIEKKIHGTGGPEAKLTVPTANAIYSPNFGNDAIKTGRASLGTGYQDILVEGLNPQQLYFVYFVTQGTGQVYSQNVMLYQFTTTDVNRPHLRLTQNSTAVVDVRSTNMNAIADFAIFLRDHMPDDLKVSLRSVLSSDYLDANGNLAADAPDELRQAIANGYCVYDALTAQYPTGGSYFDSYVSSEHKDKIRALVSGRTPDTGRIDGSISVDLRNNVTLPVNCETTYNMEPILEYIFVAQARSVVADEGVDANSFGFSAYQPVFIRDTDPPVITRISANRLVVDYIEGGKITGNLAGYLITSGTVTLTFDKDLYLYRTPTLRDAFTTTTIRTNFQYSSSDSITVQSGTSTGDTERIRSVTLALNNVREGDTFTVNPNVVSLYSSPDPNKMLTLDVRYAEETNEVIFTVTPNDPWFPAGSVRVQAQTLIKPGASGLILSASSLGMEIGETAAITATPVPDNALGRITWTIESSTVASIDPTTGNSTTVTALKKGTTRLRATLANGTDRIDSPWCEIEVTPRMVSNITLSKTNLSFKSGQQQLTATVEPGDAEKLNILATVYDANGNQVTDKLAVTVQSTAVPNRYNIYVSRHDAFTTGEFVGTVVFSATDGSGTYSTLAVSLTS